MSVNTEPVLSVRDLTIEFVVPGGVIRAVDGVSYDLYPGDVLGVVGESGSGKSVGVMSMLGLLPSPPARIVGGSVIFEGQDLLKLNRRQLRKIRGKRIAMVFQDPMAALNPVFKIGAQLAEAIRIHNPSATRAEVRRRGIEILEMVGIPEPAARYDQYPHQFSGGMRQRAMIA
ncbi:MAG TPA: ABC transporter ATP-binding protein, partial [Acidimicrobiia bacterium]|nr:ABC transporter ATP-binding protein [Acidimicrobiia bacterium]